MYAHNRWLAWIHPRTGREQMMNPTHRFQADQLLPDQWSNSPPQTNDFYVYNPAIVRFRDRLLMTYRVDSGRRESMQRRIALCELDEYLNIIPGSVVPFSSTIPESDSRHYDPRFLVHQDRLFLYYNNNFTTRPNQISIVKVDPDSLEAKSPPRPLQLNGPRQEIEKNWMFFEHDGDLYAVYQISPHIILRVDLSGTGPITCRPVHTTQWDTSRYASRYGVPCGGAPPVRRGDVYVSFFHSRIQVGPLRNLLPFWPQDLVDALPRYPTAALRRIEWLLDQRRYYGGVYAFEAKPPFAPRWLAYEPVLRPETEPSRSHRRRINPTAESVVYPCGAVVQEDGSWLVSYGLHDERCCLRQIHLTLSGNDGQSE